MLLQLGNARNRFYSLHAVPYKHFHGIAGVNIHIANKRHIFCPYRKEIQDSQAECHSIFGEQIHDLQRYYNLKFEKGRLDGKGGLYAKTVKNHSAIIGKALKDAMYDDLIAYNPNERVNLPKKTVTIKNTIVKVKTVIEKERTKNKSSYRTLQLTDEIMQALKAEQARQKDNKRLFGDEYDDNDYICKRADGSSFAPNTFTANIQMLMRKAGLPVIRLHDLRHTTASLLLNLGHNLKEIQEWLGHSDIATTANVYAHLDITSKQNIANNFSKVLAI